MNLKDLQVSHLRKFLENTESFAGITMNGFYTVDEDVFFKFYELFLKTGNNYLNHYHNIVTATMGSDDHVLYHKQEIDDLEYSMSLNIVTDFIGVDILDKVENLIEASKERLDYRNSYKQKRIKASIYTSTPSIRNKIFERDGKICKHCKSGEDLTLDHIIPVSKDGLNELDNLQVLCRSCNSIKGDKIEMV